MSLVYLCAALATVALVVVVWKMRERRRNTIHVELVETEVLIEEREAPETRSCPVCLNEYAGTASFCMLDGAELVDGPAGGVLAQGMICPTCRRGFPHDANFCPDDAEELVPFALYTSTTRSHLGSQPPLGKICPECGDRHATVHTFCGKDGSRLIVVN